MPKTLRLNKAAIKMDYIAAMESCIDRLMEQYYREVTAGMRTERGRADVQTEKLNADEKNILVRRIIGGVHAVMDSWGTGSLMATDNPALDDYMNSDLWNPERPRTPGAPIYGRPEGDYTNIFGETVHSSGRFAGVPLEGFLDSPIKPQAPSGAFQDADAWFKASDMAREEIKKATTEFFSTVRRNPGKYFHFG